MLLSPHQHRMRFALWKLQPSKRQRSTRTSKHLGLKACGQAHCCHAIRQMALLIYHHLWALFLIMQSGSVPLRLALAYRVDDILASPRFLAALQVLRAPGQAIKESSRACNRIQRSRP